MQVSQSESQSPAHLSRPIDERSVPPDSFPIAPEDFLRVGVEAQLIPFIIFATLRAEESPNGEPLFSPAEAEILVETLDKVCLPSRIPPHVPSQQGSGRVIRHSESKLEE